MGQIECKNCNKTFTIFEEDNTFYKKMKVPPPTHCPDCRQQRRWGYRNQNNLYKRKCDYSGEEMISLYSPDKPYKVYKEEIWWSDKWDPLDYGRDFDFNRPFFDQFNDLLLSVPRRGMHQDGTNENCEYITFGMSNKNCYLMFSCFYCEDIYFASLMGMSKDCADCRSCMNGELLYECYSCERCYNCIHCNDCENCQDSLFLEDCRNCKYCISCKNLRNKEYHIRNKPVSKEEFENYKEKVLKGDLLEEEKEFNKWKLNFPYVCLDIVNSEDSIGEYIAHAKNCHHCYSMVLGAQDCNYCQVAGWKGKDLWDCTMTGKESELLYEMHATITSHNCAFTSFCRICTDTYYCDCVSNLQKCFGCTGLSHKKYCVLNKQYSKEEYEELLPKIIEHMQKTQEWGEFFPLKFSPFAYNETRAQEYFPLTKEEASSKGYKWLETKTDIISKNSTDKEALACIECNKNYRIIPQELRFYKKMGLPKPKKCFDCRRKRREKLVRLQKLYDRKCEKCRIDIQTSFAPSRPEIVYCAKCYTETVI